MTDAKAKMSTRHFLRIPGRSDEQASAKLLIDGEKISVAELVGRLPSADSSLRSRALSILARVPSPNRSDIHTITNVLYSLSQEVDSSDATLYERTLLDFIQANATHPEALSIGAQLVKISNFRSREISTALISALTDALDTVTPITSVSPKQEIAETRYILLRALEAEQLASIAKRHIVNFLRDQTASLALERKTFASHVLALLRTCSTQHDSEVDLRKLATCVFTTGFAPPISISSPPSPPRANGMPTATPNEATPSGMTTAALGLVQKLVADERNEFVPRLMPQDFQVLRQVTGLQLEVFRVVTERIRRRAASDPWARVAVLDLVRSQHEPEVTALVRTAVLGALVNDARRIGKLSTQLEKEVFAISAEIPDLPFLIEKRSDGEDLSDVSAPCLKNKP